MPSPNSSHFDSFGKPHLLITGRVGSAYIEHNGQSGVRSTVEVATMSPDAMMENLVDFSNVGVISLDGLFVPYSTDYDNSGVPRFVNPTNTTDVNVNKLNPFLPNELYGTGDAASVREQRYYESGHNIQVANTLTQIGSGVDEDMNFNKHLHDSTSMPVHAMSVAHRLPMIGGGWGYDINGNPVPADASDSTKFASGAFNDPSLWPIGPMDFRWDAARGVWTMGGDATIHLVKVTNVYNPSCFSYEVQRSTSRAQYTRDTMTAKAYDASAAIHDPEYLAYTADSNNVGCFERLDYDGLEYPHYEAFVIRTTSTDVGSTYYNLWTDDCQDCGHIANSGCGTQHGSSSTNKKILIENPLRQSLNAGDLAFTMKTGRTKEVNTGSFSGGTGSGASGVLNTDANGNLTGVVQASGSGYSLGAFAIIDGNICASVTLNMSGGAVSSITVTPSGGFPANQSYPLAIYPTDATADTESLDIHWILQAEFKSQQVTSHVECDGGILQTCNILLQTQGFKSCEHCGEDTTLINNTI